ncbi:MAG: hypothetical protein CVV45_00655 [Spirochaetae bacterium HGW-Spirochaetae-10]|nr:MAG: hypothetical protein CVV45_00655 [Spirochaetae bacterium HGW-Spirochaetae-10]
MTAASTTSQSESNLPDAEPSPLSWDAIAKKAESIYRDHNLNPGFDIEQLIKNLGGEIVRQDFDEWQKTEDGSIVVLGPQNFKIYLSAFTGLFRNRFTLAHELGHYFIHSKCGIRPLKAARSGTNKAEGQANWFAGALLMPKDVFLRACREWKDDDLLAGHFQVSGAALQRRKEILNVG